MHSCPRLARYSQSYHVQESGDKRPRHPPQWLLRQKDVTKREGEGNGPYQKVEVLHAFETYDIEKCWFGRERFCAQEYVKIGVGALHKGIAKTKQNANREVVHNRENCGAVDRRQIDWKKMERKPRFEKKKNVDET